MKNGDCMLISGIGVLKNLKNDKEFVFKSFDLEKQWGLYQTQLNLNIHHNVDLQKDWNDLGSTNFEFIIAEEIDDEFIMIEEFDDYLSDSNNYNSFDVSDFHFEYLSDDTINLLYQIIGIEVCSNQFLKQLKDNELSIEYYEIIKNEMILLIYEGEVSASNLEAKLAEIILEKSKENRIKILDLQEKLFDELHEITGIGELNKDFILKLNENNLSEEIGFKIRENIEEIIFSNNVLENDISKQMDECIIKYHEKVNDEIQKGLLDKAENLENNSNFLNRINNSNLSNQNVLNIKYQLKDFILSDIVNADNFGEKLEGLVVNEIEKVWDEKKNQLIIYLNELIGKDEINPEFKNKLESNYLDISLASKFKDSIVSSIYNKDIATENEVDNELEKLIDVEILSINKSKDELLAQLKQNYGAEEVTTSFKSILGEVQLSADDGLEFISKLYNEIISFKLKSMLDIENRLNELILEKNKEILREQYYNLLGKNENNESFSLKLKINYLTEYDGIKIRNELLDLINTTEDVAEAIALRNGLELKLDNIISIKGEYNYNKLMDLSNDLIASLNDIIGDKQINDSFRLKLYSNNLGDEYWDLVKDEITDYIKKQDSQFDYASKMNQLNELKTNSVKKAVDKIVQRESEIRNEEYELLKSNLLSQLNDLIGVDENTILFDDLLKSNNLGEKESLTIRNDFKEIIEVDEVYNTDKFNYKYEELLDVESKTVKKLLEGLVQKQKNIYEKKLSDVRLYLLDEVDGIIGKEDVAASFKNRLYSHELGSEYGNSIKKEVRVYIKNDLVTDARFNNKLEELLNYENKGIDYKIQNVLDRESKIKLLELRELKKDLTNKLNDLTKDEKYYSKLKKNNLSSNIGNEIKNEINSLINSKEVIDSKFNYKTEELLDLDKRGVNAEIDKLINKHVQIYEDEILKVRINLQNYANEIMGKTKPKQEFVANLNKHYLSEDYVEIIRQELNEFIFSEDINDKFEFKLDELKSLGYSDINNKINEIIKYESDLKQEELDEIRKNLNNSLINLIGEKNNDYYKSLLKKNNLNSQMGIVIRRDLVNLINSKNPIDKNYKFKLDELLDLEKLGIENKLIEFIEIKVTQYNNELAKIKSSLIQELTNILNSQSFKNKLQDNQLHYSFKKEFEKEISDFINSDEIFDSKFEVKLSELNALKSDGIDSKVEELIKRESEIKSQELTTIRSELLDSIDDLIGLKENNEYYSDLLKSKNLNYETGKSIRKELIGLVYEGNLFYKDSEFKLDDLIKFKQIGMKKYLMDIIEREEESYNKNLKDIREKLLVSLNSIIYDKSFKESLYSKQIGDSFIKLIDNELSVLIKSNSPCDDKFEVKLDELKHVDKKGIRFKIDQLVKKEADSKQNLFKQLKIELTEELYRIIGNDKNSQVFDLKLKEYNLNNETKDKIRKDFINLVSSDNCADAKFKFKLEELEYLKEYGLENKVNDVLKRENEIYNVKLKELRESLIDSVNSIIGKNNIDLAFKHKIKSFGLDEGFANNVKQQLIEFINSDEISNKDFEVKLDELTDLNNKGIQSEIDDIIRSEIERRDSILKENLLKELHHVTGSGKLSETFLNRLDNAGFDEEFGLKIKLHFESEIDSLRIQEGFEFEKAIDEMICDENKNILLNKIHEIIGRESNSEYYDNILKSNCITSKRGDEIRELIVSSINGADFDAIVELKKRGMQDVFDEIISNEASQRQKLLIDLKEKLLNELYEKTNKESFKTELNSKNIPNNHVYKIQLEIKDFIDSDVVIGDFEYKVDELDTLNQVGIDFKINQVVTEIEEKINNEFDELKSQLLSELNEESNKLTSNIDFGISGISLKLNNLNLTKDTGKIATDKLKEIIISDEINDSKFNTKFEELQDIKNRTIPIVLTEILDEYHNSQEFLFGLLDSEVQSIEFKKDLRNNNLRSNIVDSLEKEIKNKIESNDITNETQLKNEIHNYIRHESIKQNNAIDKLYEKVGKKGISLKFRAKLMLHGLSSSDVDIISQNIEDKIRNEKLRAGEIDEEIENQIKSFDENKRKKPKFVFCEQCGHKNINGYNFCEKCGARLSKL